MIELVLTIIGRDRAEIAGTFAGVVVVEVGDDRPGIVHEISTAISEAGISTVSGTATSFTDTKLSARTSYTYRVRAGNAIGLSPYSNLASARTLR